MAYGGKHQLLIDWRAVRSARTAFGTQRTSSTVVDFEPRNSSKPRENLRQPAYGLRGAVEKKSPAVPSGTNLPYTNHAGRQLWRHGRRDAFVSGRAHAPTPWT
jgi:hypothetical protein